VEIVRWTMYIGIPIIIGYYATPDNIARLRRALHWKPAALGPIDEESVAEFYRLFKARSRKERDERLAQTQPQISFQHKLIKDS